MSQTNYLFLLISFSFSLLSTLTSAQPTPTQNADSLVQVPNGTLPIRDKFFLVDSLKYRFIGDGNFTRGNVNRTLLIFRAEITYEGTIVSLATHPRYTYGEQNGMLAEKETYVDLFIDIYKKRKVYGFGLATIEVSNLRAIDLRQLAGAGVGIRLRQTREHSLSFTNAIIYESTNFRERATLTALRNSARLKGKHSFLQDKIRLTHITFLQPALNDISNVRWNTIVTIELPLNKWISIRSSFENSFESVVEASRKRNDTRFTVGISVGNKH